MTCYICDDEGCLNCERNPDQICNCGNPDCESGCPNEYEIIRIIEDGFLAFPDTFKVKKNYATIVIEDGSTLGTHTKKVVCPDCDGEGTELRGGLKGAVFAGDELSDCDTRETLRNMMRGDYDVACSRCQGKNVVTIPYVRGISNDKTLLKLYNYFCAAFDARAEREQEEAGERRWGC